MAKFREFWGVSDLSETDHEEWLERESAALVEIESLAEGSPLVPDPVDEGD